MAVRSEGVICPLPRFQFATETGYYGFFSGYFEDFWLSLQIVILRSRSISPMRWLVSILCLITFVGCSDVVTTRFSNLADAKSQGAFERGWLPPLLPDSAKAIVERNDLDLNTGTGSFKYDLRERTAYIKRLTEAGALSRTEGDIDILTLSTNDSRWEIRLPRASGSGEWSITAR